MVYLAFLHLNGSEKNWRYNMKINKNSWHFKLHKWVVSPVYQKLKYGENVSLCRYFWGTVGCVIAAIFTLMFSTVVVMAVFSTVTSPLYFLLVAFTGLDFLGKGYADVGGVFLIISIPISLIIGLIAAFRGEMEVFPSWLKFSSENTRVQRKPSLILNYVKAKKDKICPLVELED